MNILFSVLLGLGGFALIFNNATLARIIYEHTQLRFYKIASELGISFLDSKTCEIVLIKLDRLGLIFAGAVLILIAIAGVLGPTTI